MSTKKLLESLALNEKINHTNDDINRAIANPKAGKNKEKIKDMGYEAKETDDGKVYAIRNPKTKRWLDPSQYSREEKKKVDFKGKLDSTRPYMVQTARYSQDAEENKIPKSAKVGVDKAGNSVYNQSEVDSYSPRYFDEKKKSISSNINDYNKAVKDRDENRKWAERKREKDIPYYEKKVKDAQKDLEFQKNYTDNLENSAKNAEEKRQALMAKVREKHQKTTESDEYVNSLSIPKLLEEIYQGYTEIFESNDFWEDLSNMFDFDEAKLKKWLQNLADEAGTGE